MQSGNSETPGAGHHRRRKAGPPRRPRFWNPRATLARPQQCSPWRPTLPQPFLPLPKRLHGLGNIPLPAMLAGLAAPADGEEQSRKCAAGRPRLAARRARSSLLLTLDSDCHPLPLSIDSPATYPFSAAGTARQQQPAAAQQPAAQPQQEAPQEKPCPTQCHTTAKKEARKLARQKCVFVVPLYCRADACRWCCEGYHLAPPRRCSTAAQSVASALYC